MTSPKNTAQSIEEQKARDTGSTILGQLYRARAAQYRDHGAPTEEQRREAWERRVSRMPGFTRAPND